MKFAYEALDQRGNKTAGTIDAATLLEAGDALASRGRFVERLAADDDSKPAGKSGVLARLQTARSRLIANFARDLAVLVSTGTPLIDALSALERQTTDATFKAVIGGVRGRVEDGNQLTDALAEFPKHFDSVFRSLVAAGETGGNLDAMLQRIAALTERQARTRATIIGSLTYPAVLVLICAAVLGAMFTIVLPRFAIMFETLNVPLPISTEIMISISNALRGYWWAFLIAALAAGGTIAWIALAEQNRQRVMALALRLPVVGVLMRDFALARIARVMGTLLESSVPFLESLSLTRQGVSNPDYVTLLDNAEAAVTAGETVSGAFASSSLVSPAFAEALRAGETAGRVGPVLQTLADHMDTDNEARLKSATKLLEPLILAFLGVVVGIVAISLFLPLFDLTASAGGKP